ncbi:CxC2 domain-containing protein [Mycena kentingensis (nom. inval.)]|nr:CxC2 domain-containing protein [Mycena kentingensis (nom. inval.)]
MSAASSDFDFIRDLLGSNSTALSTLSKDLSSTFQSFWRRLPPPPPLSDQHRLGHKYTYQHMRLNFPGENLGRPFVRCTDDSNVHNCGRVKFWLQPPIELVSVFGPQDAARLQELARGWRMVKDAQLKKRAYRVAPRAERGIGTRRQAPRRIARSTPYSRSHHHASPATTPSDRTVVASSAAGSSPSVLDPSRYEPSNPNFAALAYPPIPFPSLASVQDDTESASSAALSPPARRPSPYFRMTCGRGPRPAAPVFYTETGHRIDHSAAPPAEAEQSSEGAFSTSDTAQDGPTEALFGDFFDASEIKQESDVGSLPPAIKMPQEGSHRPLALFLSPGCPPTASNANLHQHTTTSSTGSTTTQSVLARQHVPKGRTPPQATSSAPMPEMPEVDQHTEEAAQHVTQNAQFLADFSDHVDDLSQYLLDHEHSTMFGKMNSPFHWAEVWDAERGFLVRNDISQLGHVIQLGHGGDMCPESSGGYLFTVVDVNGIHSTRVAFCGCREYPPNKLRQLMAARLFPASARDPGTAFTINLLKQFQLHNLESKKSAYDFLKALRRLTDNCFTADVPKPYESFLRIIRLFNHLTLRKRAGQLHNIDQQLGHRPPGNVRVWCPACPEPGFNSDPNCPKTPKDLRHLNQSQRTLDGNFQTNQYSKNNDPNDVSLAEGAGDGDGYIPKDSRYRDYLKKTPNSKEKSNCTGLNAVNKQNKKKFKNMAVTGTINCQCSHVFVLSTVDMHDGERFANADAALARALRQRAEGKTLEFKLQLEAEDVDNVATYDIACAYIIHLLDRFKVHFPDLVDQVQKMRWGIPALHVQGHKDSCTYMFGTAYMECVGHFYGETAEQYWPEANQLGALIRQMNSGHRHDTLIFHHGDWNWKKTVKIYHLLFDQYKEAAKKSVEKRNHFIALCISHKEYFEEWNGRSRLPELRGGEVYSAYKHNSSKVPSQATIFKKMVSDDSNFRSMAVPQSKVAQFLNDAFQIQDSQRKLAAVLADHAQHALATMQREITNRSTKLRNRLNSWRKIQGKLTPLVGDFVAAQTKKSVALHEERLFLPSDFTQAQRIELGLVDLAAEEALWREAQVFDELRAVQNLAKGITVLHTHKLKNDRQQKDNSRSGDNIREATRLRDSRIASYHSARAAIISINGSTHFPTLREEDLYMKPVHDKRRIGDSNRMDGRLWTISQASRIDAGPSSAGIRLSDPEVLSGTQMERRQTGPRKKRQKTSETTPTTPLPDDRPTGWIWQLGKFSKMSDTEMDDWSREGDRVQWSRAEAEMLRWREEREQKLAELLRSTRSFSKMAETWTSLADQSNSAGHQAYAKQKAAMYQALGARTRQVITDIGYQHLLDTSANLVTTIQEERKSEEALIYTGIFGHD